MPRLWPVRLSLSPSGEPSLQLVESRRARWLIGQLSPPDRPLPVQAGGTRAQSGAAMTTLVPDDQGALVELLDQVARSRPPDHEHRVEGVPLSIWRVEGSPAAGHIQELLEDVALRPLARLSETRAVVALLSLADPSLRLQPIHRGIAHVPIFREETFLPLVATYARVYELEEPLTSPSGRAVALARLASLASGYHAVLLVLPRGRGKILRFRQGLDLQQVKAAPRNPTLRSLDLVLLQALVFRTVLGITAPEAEDHPQIVSTLSFDELQARVDRGELQAGFVLNPPPLWELRAVIEAAQVIPPLTVQVQPQAPPLMTEP